jgi:dipeptidyl aminopeptidase/acylaminoacyl peptidase
MRKYFALLLAILFIAVSGRAQKKPLDHSVYDSWQSIGEKWISHNGNWVVYTVNPQEGDGVLVIQRSDGSYRKEIQRGYMATISEDDAFVVFKIRPLFKETRDAKIKKKKPEEMPKDSLGILEFGKDSVILIPGVKNYKMPEKAEGWLAWLHEKGFPVPAKTQPDSISRLQSLTHMADSLSHLADSLKNKVAEAEARGLKVLQSPKKEGKKNADDAVEEGTELVLRNLHSGEQKCYLLSSDFLFSKKGNRFALATTKKNGDSLSKNYMLLLSLPDLKTDTILTNFNEEKNITFDEEGNQLAFVAERDSAKKALRKFFKLYYYRSGQDSASMKVDANSGGLCKGETVSENYALQFSKDGSRLFLGVAPIRPIKDTTVPDFEKAGVDIWNYQDDNLQPVQLKNLERDLKKSYLAIWEPGKNGLLSLGNEKFPYFDITMEGNGETFYTSTDSGKRVELQWQGYTLKDVYAVNSHTGEKKLIIRDLKGYYDPSYTGKWLLLYDSRKKNYSIYNSQSGQLKPVASDIRFPLYDEENDVPDDPGSYGIAGWTEGDKYVLLYDRYDIWLVDPEGKENSRSLTSGRKDLVQFHYLKLDREEKYIKTDQDLYLRSYDEKNKDEGLFRRKGIGPGNPGNFLIAPGSFSLLFYEKARENGQLIFTKESFSQSPDLYVYGLQSIQQLSHINPQQAGYLWGKAELYKWKAYTGRVTEGVVYKPEGFDPMKKYPMIVYYYERNNNTLNYYQPPSPTPSRLNIPFFVSSGYIVFVPDIWYTKGHPGKSAYDYIMSGTRALIKNGFVDSTKIGIQGQSWGGYQTAYLITQTHLFAAAWAGAPVVNMFSAYGGIRWESGYNRQMQYEKGQSRIGATIWERPDLYIENSPLFHLQNVKTPLVIMSNDADGAVPWYQGIEFFTAMRRLHKPVWLLQYNGEAHNLVERRNRKDIQMREQQYFDWLLKGAQAPLWITKGVPATLKGIDWGLGQK